MNTTHQNKTNKQKYVCVHAYEHKTKQTKQKIYIQYIFYNTFIHSQLPQAQT